MAAAQSRPRGQQGQAAVYDRGGGFFLIGSKGSANYLSPSGKLSNSRD